MFKKLLGALTVGDAGGAIILKKKTKLMLVSSISCLTLKDSTPHFVVIGTTVMVTSMVR